MNGNKCRNDESSVPEQSDEKTVVVFQTAFQKRFLIKTVKSSDSNFDIELKEMKQRPNETIQIYYKRFLALMVRYEVKDRLMTECLSTLESAILDITMKTVVLQEIIRGLTVVDRFFRELFVLAEDADRSRRKFQKLMEEENRFRELEFYKESIRTR